MRKVIADVWMTLDGVVQSPSYADEDVTGGFGHGGWHAHYLDDVAMKWVIENVRGAGGYQPGDKHGRDHRDLCGRRCRRRLDRV